MGTYVRRAYTAHPRSGTEYTAAHRTRSAYAGDRTAWLHTARYAATASV